MSPAAYRWSWPLQREYLLELVARQRFGFAQAVVRRVQFGAKKKFFQRTLSQNRGWEQACPDILEKTYSLSPPSQASLAADELKRLPAITPGRKSFYRQDSYARTILYPLLLRHPQVK